MKPIVLPLSSQQSCDASLTGGKGSSLARNSILGFPIPRGFIVTAHAYELFLNTQSNIEIGDLSNLSPTQLENKASNIRRKLEECSLPQPVIEAISEAFKEGNTEASFAVRSSGTMEDLEGAAFAGQHDTFLGVFGLEEILEKVKACYLSLWSGHALSYREGRGFDHQEAQMAVVVQELVPAEIAGVAFTIDPVAERVDRVFIEAAWGLGETVVSGEGGTDQFIINRDDLSIISKNIGDKEFEIIPDGKTTKICPTNERAKEASLDEKLCTTITQLALKVEQAAGFPQDLEWAIANDKVYLLQARPVTVLPERWTRDESAERFPNPVTPLTWDFVESGFHDALKHSLDLMGLPPLTGRWFAKFDNYIYGNQNAVDVYMGRPPALPKNLEELRVALPAIRQKFSWAVELPSRWAMDLDRYLLAIGAVNAAPINDMKLDELWSQVEKINNIGSSYFRNNIAISLTQSMLHKTMHYAITMVAGPKEAAQILDALTSSTETKTALVNEEIREMSEVVLADAALKKLLEENNSRSILAHGKLSNFPKFQSLFNEFLIDHGHRELDFDPYCSNWLDSPWTALDTIILASRTPQMSGKEKAREARLKARHAEHELLNKLPEDLRFFFSELIRLTRDYTALDDIEHYQTSRMTIPMRNTLGEIGKRFIKLNICEEPFDVYFAQADTLAKYCKAPNSETFKELKEEISNNKAQYLEARDQEPSFILGDDSVSEVDCEDALRGIAGSPGKVEGNVSIIRSPDDFLDFTEGSILVARTTNPAWTPLFHIAGGVVVESGGPLSHGAVTAREMGIPAVMALKGAMNLFNNGDHVRIDGGTGQVEILKTSLPI